jgi:hypothetical protein
LPGGQAIHQAWNDQQNTLDVVIELVYQLSITGGNRGAFHDFDAG